MPHRITGRICCQLLHARAGVIFFILTLNPGLHFVFESSMLLISFRCVCPYHAFALAYLYRSYLTLFEEFGLHVSALELCRIISVDNILSIGYIQQ